jgi:hypothetical protein
MGLDVVECRCNYKCRHTSFGFQLVTRVAKIRHHTYDIIGHTRQSNRSSSNYDYYPCSFCKGKVRRAPRTIYEHIQAGLQISNLHNKEVMNTHQSISMDLYHVDDPVAESRNDHGFEEEFSPKEQPLERYIQMKLLQFQSILDASNVSISNQNEILKILFGKIGDFGDKNVENQCLESLIRMLPSPWDGRLDGFQFPDFFYDIFNLY